MSHKQPLPEDPESAEIWRNLPQTPPSKDALPPLMGGGNILRAWWFWLFVIFAALALLSLAAGRM
ncbi:MAG: hypothetical protein IAE80_05050 [Anaerolinea sp.]|nr:hypothetical protein [Anaerolinea sp.]